MSQNVVPTSLHLLAQRAGELYSLPGVALEMLRLTSLPEVDASLLKNCLERDPALTTRILKVVNSSLFGLSRKVSDLSQAVALLGVRPLKMLVLGFSLPRALLEDVERDVLASYWRFALTKAAASRELSQKVFATSGDDAFIAGLLADVGVLVLVQQLQAPYCRLVREVGLGPQLLTMERELLGFDHVTLGGELLKQWGLPESLILPASSADGDDPLAALPPTQRVLPQTVRLGELLTLLVANHDTDSLRELLARGEQYCGLKLDEVQTITAEVEKKVTELGEILALGLSPNENYLETLATAQAQLAALTIDSVDLLVRRDAPELKLLGDATQLHHDLREACQQAASGPREPLPVHVPTEVWTPASSAKVHAAPHLTIGKHAPTEQKLLLHVSDALVRCRHQQHSLSLALMGLDRANSIQLPDPVEVSEAEGERIAASLDAWSQERGLSWHLRGNQFALIWEDCPRTEALELVRHIARQMQEASAQPGGLLRPGTTVSTGLATISLPSRNFPAKELIYAAQRCLSGAILTGGGAVKSIEF